MMADMQTHQAPSAAMQTHQAPSALLDYEGAAPILGCSPRMVRNLVEQRKIDFVKVGKLVRIEPAALERYIEGHRRKAVAGS